MFCRGGPHGDARERIVPEEFQPHPAFCGQRPVVVQNAPFAATGFTRASPGRRPSAGMADLPTLPVEVRRAIAAGEPFVYAYYDGIDKIAHEFGFGEHYDAELAAVDRMVADLLPMLPPAPPWWSPPITVWCRAPTANSIWPCRRHRCAVRCRVRAVSAGCTPSRVVTGMSSLRLPTPTANRPGCSPANRSSTRVGSGPP